MEIKLYNIPDKILSPSVHRAYESFQNLLNTYTGANVRSFDDSQFIKIDMHLDIKVQLSQYQLGPMNTPKYNYCSILFNGKYYYYFIDRRTWKGKECCLLSMTMDTVNTFFNGHKSTGAFIPEYIFSPRTRVIREHKNRFIKGTRKNTPIIDYYPEDINPTQYKKTDVTIDSETYEDEDDGETYNSNIRWNLMYVTNNEENVDLKANPLRVYLIPNEKITYKHTNSRSENVPMDLLDPAKIYIKPRGAATIGEASISDSATEYSFIYYDTNHGWTLVYTNARDNGTATSTTINGVVTMNEIEKFGTVLAASSLGKSILNEAVFQVKLVKAAAVYSVVEDFFFIGSNTSLKYLIGLNEFDLTDSKIVKLIACPYCPIPAYPLSNNDLKIIGNVEYTCGRLILKEKQFENYLNYPHIVSPDAYVSTQIGVNTNISPSNSRSADIDPKLYSSEFFTYKLVYDSFTKEIPLEEIQQMTDDYGLSVIYKQTSTINSKFLFKVDSLTFLFSKEDYPEYLVCARNNERAIYSNSYINYLRTGFNYDVKNKEAKNNMNWINFSLGALSTGLSTGVSVATGNAFMAAGAVRTAFSTVSSAISNIHQANQAERDLRQKQESLKQQSLSVSGSDDIDLLEYYNDNRLHIMTYSPSDYNVKLLQDLFHYFGYATNERKVPDINSRYWFNFIQCEIEFANANVQWEDFMNDLKQKFLEGITIFHYHNRYDLDQEHANWENSIL